MLVALLQDLQQRFRNANIHSALMGGAALVYYAAPRNTADLDFLVLADDIALLDTVMSDMGYSIHFRSDDVTHFTHPTLPPVDTVIASRPRARQILAQAITKPDGIVVLKPEDTIGFKLQAVRNNPRRELKDFADILAIVDNNSQTLDWKILEDYFTQFGFADKFGKLRPK